MSMNKVYRQYNEGKLLAIHKNNGTFVDTYGTIHQCQWGAEFEDCVVPISPESGRQLAHCIGKVVSVMSPSIMKKLMLWDAEEAGCPFVSEAFGEVVAIEGNIIRFADCQVATTYQVANRVASIVDKHNNVHVMKVQWTNDMQRMFDAIDGLMHAARAVGRGKMADGYELVYNWLWCVRYEHVIVESI